MTSASEKKVAAVVGVGSGLGAALARRFAVGYKVALIARSTAVTEPVAEEIRATGGVAVPQACCGVMALPHLGLCSQALPGNEITK